MKKHSIATAFCVLFLCQACFRMRWPDHRAYAAFERKGVPLQLNDTLVEGHTVHWALSSMNDSLPTLVFIHGSPGSWFHYRRFLLDTALNQRFRMLAIDRPGFGHSNFGHALHLADQARVLAPLLSSLKTTSPMFLCGHSMGGPVVVKLAADHPGMFEGIVVVAGAIDVAQEKKERWRHWMGRPGSRWLLPGAFRPSNTELLYLKEDLLPLQADFDNIRCQVNFVHGDRDTWVPIENVAFGQKMMRNAKSIEIDTLRGADHQIPWKRYLEMKEILLRLR